MEKFSRTPFLKNNFVRLLLKLVEFLFFEVFFVSLDKSVLLRCRCLMFKFSKILLLRYSKIFSAFYPILHETFPNSYGFSNMPWKSGFPLSSRKNIKHLQLIFSSHRSTVTLPILIVREWLKLDFTITMRLYIYMYVSIYLKICNILSRNWLYNLQVIFTKRIWRILMHLRLDNYFSYLQID